jgi:trk system potassium uptake protein TrkA
MFVIIVGGGQVGSHLATLLLAGGHKVHLIDERSDVLAKIHRELPTECIFEGDGADVELLRLTGIEHAEVVAAVTGSDETNLMVTHLARFEFQVPRIIGRVNSPKNAWLFTPEMGVDVAIDQADMIAHLIAEEMSLGDMMTLMKLRKGQYSLVEEKVHPTAVAVGKAIRDLKLPAECVLAAVIRKGTLIIPRGDLVLQAADEILAVVHSAEVTALAQLLARTD